MMTPRSSCPGGEYSPLRGANLRLNYEFNTVAENCAGGELADTTFPGQPQARSWLSYEEEMRELLGPICGGPRIPSNIRVKRFRGVAVELELTVELDRLKALVAAFAVPTIFYIVRRQAGLATAQTVVQACLNTLDVAPIDQATLLAAQALSGPDFEDDLQIACAVQCGVDAIATRDPRGFAASPIPALTPADLVVSLSGPPTP